MQRSFDAVLSEHVSLATSRRREEDQVPATHTPCAVMDSGTPSDELSRLLGLGLEDCTPILGSGSMRVPGDFYRDDPDNITRSTMIGSGLAGPGEVLNSAFLAASNFYEAEDKVVRGVTLPVGAHFEVDSDQLQFNIGGLGGSGFAKDPQSKAWKSDGFASENMKPVTPMAQNECAICFSKEDLPRPVPDDEFFTLCATTLDLVCETPFLLGNCLLDFLANEVTSSVTKVRREKFCIKADVFIGNSMCTTKIKVWKQASPDRVSVEIQRRRGDIPTFNDIFQRASMYLKSHFQIVGDIPSVSSGLCAPPPLPSSVDPLLEGDACIEISPALDMAGQIHNTPIQAESAAMLANLTDNEQTAALCTPEAAQAVTNLLKEDATEVALPTARILLALSTCSAAIPYFISIGHENSSSGFLDLSIEKIRSCTSCTLVRRTLAQAVATAIGACVAYLSQEQVSQLNTAINAAIWATSEVCRFPGAAADTDVIGQSLKTAAMQLSTQ